MNSEAPRIGNEAAPPGLISQAMDAARRNLPSGVEAAASAPEGTVPAGELRADGFHCEGFVFPEPTTVGYQAIAVLSQRLSRIPDDQVEMIKGNRMTLGIAWVSWATRNEKNEELLAYATGGEVPMKEAAEALNSEIQGADFVRYMRAAAGFMAWVAESFRKGTEAPEPSAAEPSNTSSGSASGSSSK